MKRIILAILSVALIQFSFQVYMAVDRSDAEYRAMKNDAKSVRGVPMAELKTAELPEPDLDPAAAFARVERPKLRVPQLQPQRHENVTIAIKPVPTPLFAPVIINIPPKQKYLETRSALPPALAPSPSPAKTVASRREGPPEDRSFMAKAWPVVKKPVDWIKTLASKLK